MELTKILQKVLEIGGSDLFLIPGSPATAKVKGHLVPLTESKLLPEDTAGMIQEAYGMAGGTATRCSAATATTIFPSPSTGRRASAEIPTSSAARWRRPAAS